MTDNRALWELVEKWRGRAKREREDYLSTADNDWDCAADELAAILERPVVVGESPLGGRWHHGNGYLVCGSFRIAKADWEAGVCASDNLRERIFDWICETLNGKDAPAISSGDWGAWAVASVIRAEMDKQSCPDHWMRLAVESSIQALESMVRGKS